MVEVIRALEEHYYGVFKYKLGIGYWKQKKLEQHAMTWKLWKRTEEILKIQNLMRKNIKLQDTFDNGKGGCGQ